MILRGIGMRLTVAVVLMILLTIGIFSWFIINSFSKSLLSEVERHAIQISQSMVASTEYDMLLNDPDRVHEIIKRLGNQGNIDRIRLLNKAGKVTSSTDSSEIGHTLDGSTESCRSCHSVDPPLRRLDWSERTRVFQRPEDDSRMLGVITPIYNQKSC